MLTATASNATATARFPAHAARPSPAVTRGLILLSIGVGFGAALFAGSAGETAHAVSQAGPDLTRLLRAMAAIKTAMAAGAVAALLWRLGSAASLVRLGLYAASAASMAAGPALIWQMVHVGAGAALLHGGLLACALLLWRDPATASMLQAAIARRRARA